MRVHKDTRRTAYCDLFDTPGDVNLFIVEPGQRTCWHRHQKQTDQFRCIRGKIIVQCVQGDIYHRHWLANPEQICVVEPGWWHGYANETDEPAYLLMYLSQKYDPTDEEQTTEVRLPWDQPLIAWPPLVDDMWNKGQDPDPDNTA